MGKELAKTRADEITALHNEILGNLRMCLDKAIRIGELLTEQKDALPHGEFTLWIEKNLPFTDRTARNYMRLYRERDRLKTETVSDLKSAYRLLTPPVKSEGDDWFWYYEKDGLRHNVDFKTWVNGVTFFELDVARRFHELDMRNHKIPPGHENDPDYAPPLTTTIDRLLRVLISRNTLRIEEKSCGDCCNYEPWIETGECACGHCDKFSGFIVFLPTDPICEFYNCSWSEYHRINEEKRKKIMKAEA